MENKMFFGTGEAAACAAQKAGASKATASRIRSGKQNSWQPNYHQPLSRTFGLPKTKKNIVELTMQCIHTAWHEIPIFDKDDLCQEIIIRLWSPSWPKKMSDGLVAYIIYSIIREYKRGKGKAYLRENFGRELDCENLSSEFFDPYIYNSEDEAQKLLNACESGSDLWYVFRRMRKTQHGGRCQKCGTDEDWTLHHIYPRKCGQENTEENTAGLCRPCHDEIEFVNGMAEAMHEQPKLTKEKYHSLFQNWLKIGCEETLKKETEQ